MSPEAWRLCIFFGVLSGFTLLEFRFRARANPAQHVKRLSTNAAILFLGSLLLQVIAMVAPAWLALGAAQWASAQGFGLLNFVSIPIWFSVALSLVFLDFAIWLQHYLTHKIPLLWRLHAVHHSDTHLDTTTALRFHPVEIALSAFYKAMLAVSLGLSPLAIFLFEIGLNAFAIFNHANLNLPRGLGRFMRQIIITPAVHRVHHSTLPTAQNKNFGFCLTIWDKVFQTYECPDANKHQNLSIGLLQHQNEKPLNLLWSILLPLRG